MMQPTTQLVLGYEQPSLPSEKYLGQDKESEQESSKPKKKKSRRDVGSMACLYCKKKRSKCQHIKYRMESCDNCIDSREECVVDPDRDGRTKGYLRNNIEALQNRQTLSQPGAKTRLPLKSAKGSILFGIQEAQDCGTTYRNSSYFTQQALGISYPGTLEAQNDQNACTANEADLVKNYFTWVHPLCNFFQEDKFKVGTGRLDDCSMALNKAVLAIGCQYSPELGVHAGDQYLMDAVLLLAQATLAPRRDFWSSLKIVQAYALVALRQLKRSEVESGRSFLVQMNYWVSKFRLGDRSLCCIDKFGTVDQDRFEAQSATFWGCFLVESFWSVYLGETWAFCPDKIGLEIPNVHFVRDMVPASRWIPHDTVGTMSPQIDAKTKCSYASATFRQFILLSEIMDDALHFINSTSIGKMVDQNLKSFYTRLQDWKQNLDDCLKPARDITGAYQTSALPHVLSLHMYYFNCLILLLRPFLCLKNSDLEISSTCSTAANAITQYLCQYKRTYSFNQCPFIITHCAMSAASIHLANFVTTLGQPISGLPPSQQPVDKLVSTISDLRAMTSFSEISGQFIKTLEVKVIEACRFLSIDVPQNILDALDLSVVGTSVMIDASLAQQETPMTQLTTTLTSGVEAPMLSTPVNGLHPCATRPKRSACAVAIPTEAGHMLPPQSMAAFQMSGMSTNGMRPANGMMLTERMVAMTGMPTNEMPTYNFDENFGGQVFPNPGENQFGQNKYDHNMDPLFSNYPPL